MTAPLGVGSSAEVRWNDAAAVGAATLRSPEGLLANSSSRDPNPGHVRQTPRNPSGRQITAANIVTYLPLSTSPIEKMREQGIAAMIAPFSDRRRRREP